MSSPIKQAKILYKIISNNHRSNRNSIHNSNNINNHNNNNNNNNNNNIINNSIKMVTSYRINEPSGDWSDDDWITLYIQIG